MNAPNIACYALVLAIRQHTPALMVKAQPGNEP